MIKSFWSINESQWEELREYTEKNSINKVSKYFKGTQLFTKKKSSQ